MLVTMWFLWRFFNLLFSWHCFLAFLVRWHCQWILAVWFGMRKRPFIWRTEHQVTFTPSEWLKVQEPSWKLTNVILPRLGYHIMISKCGETKQWTMNKDGRFISLLRTDSKYRMDWQNAVNTIKIFDERRASGDSQKACESVILLTMQTSLNNILHQKWVGYFNALISDDFSQTETFFFSQTVVSRRWDVMTSAPRFWVLHSF